MGQYHFGAANNQVYFCLWARGAVIIVILKKLCPKDNLIWNPHFNSNETMMVFQYFCIPNALKKSAEKWSLLSNSEDITFCFFFSGAHGISQGISIHVESGCKHTYTLEFSMWNYVFNAKVAYWHVCTLGYDYVSMQPTQVHPTQLPRMHVESWFGFYEATSCHLKWWFRAVNANWNKAF